MLFGGHKFINFQRSLVSLFYGLALDGRHTINVLGQILYITLVVSDLLCQIVHIALRTQ